MGIWDGIADAEAPEYQGREDLPEKQFFVVNTATKENGGAAASIREKEVDQEKGGGVSYQFNLGLIAIGGPKEMRKHKGSMIFIDAWVMPSEEGNDKNALLSGRLTGLLNAIFSPGVGAEIKDDKERAKLRWRHTSQQLSIVQARRPEIIPEAYIDKNTGLASVALFVAGCAVAALEEEAHKLIVKTKMRTFTRRSGEKGSNIEVGLFEDFTPANAASRAVVVYDAEGLVGATPTTAAGRTF